MPQSLIFFTHIPKTSGTTFFQSSVVPNIPKDQIYEVASIRQVLTDRLTHRLRTDELNVISGHFKYGMHHLFPGQPRYIVFLRDPIDRAVSFYYFIKDSNASIYRHPIRDYADSVSIEEFYQNPRFSNMICQHIAGYKISHIYQFLSQNKSIQKRLLATASAHLFNRYDTYGLLEQFEASRLLLCNRLSLNAVDKDLKKQKKTGQRPQVEDLSSRTLSALKASHEMDLELYEQAKSNFFNQFELHERESFLSNA